MLPPTGRLLAVDWGDVRIGLALSDETQVIATPLETLVRRPGKRFPMPRFLELVAEHAPVGVVVGLPLTGEGEEGASAAGAREVAEAIGRRTGLPLDLWDERMSTARALAAIREQGGSVRGRREDVDALAAAVVLQHTSSPGGRGSRGREVARARAGAGAGHRRLRRQQYPGRTGDASARGHLRRRDRHARGTRGDRQPATCSA
jgi:RNAse H-fold protein YqgF